MQDAFVASNVAMTAIANSVKAIKAVTPVSNFVNKIYASETAYTTYGNSPKNIVGKAVADFAGITSTTDIAVIAGSLDAMTKVAQSANAAMALANSTFGMNVISGNKDVLMMILSAKLIRDSVVNSPISFGSLANSSLKQTVTPSSSGGTPTVVVEGANYIISLQNAQTGSWRLDNCISNSDGYVDVAGTDKTNVGQFFERPTYGPSSGTDSGSGTIEIIEFGAYTTWQKLDSYGYTWQEWQDLGLTWAELQVYGQ
jgi:hypothetical protein